MGKTYYVEGYHPAIRDHKRVVAFHLEWAHAIEALHHAIRAGWWNLRIEEHA